jgi:hypothetical protein
MFGDRLIREIVRQARDVPHGRHNGYINIYVPGVATDTLASHIRAARDRGLIDAEDLGSHDGAYFGVERITPSGFEFLKSMSYWKKSSKLLWLGAGSLIAFMGWLIPVLISLRK